MFKLLGSALLVGGLAFLATPASAQKKSATSAPMGGFHHELGVDFAADYAKPSGVSGGIEMGLPVDIRIAFSYFTGGVALNLFDLGGPGGSATQFSLGGGVGTRVPFETAAGRIEGFLGYTFKGGGYPSNFAIGTRIGLSFWH